MISSKNLRDLAKSFNTKKRLGQNFLVNPDLLTEITSYLGIKEGDQVLEIGPGLGFLTRGLIAAGAHVTGIELDIDCVNALKNLSLPRLNIVHADFLQTDLSQFITTRTKVIGNVPYQISSPILVKLLGEIGQPSPWLKNIDRIIMTVQKEVAERFAAQAGEDPYSQISVLVDYFAQAELLTQIAPENFFPIPEVNSAVVRLIPHLQPRIECDNHKLLRQIVHAGFKQRRKMLRNTLAFLHLEDKHLLKIYQELNLDPQVRAERLKLADFAALANAIAAIVPAGFS